MKRLFYSAAASSSDENVDEQPRERKRPTLHRFASSFVGFLFFFV